MDCLDLKQGCCIEKVPTDHLSFDTTLVILSFHSGADDDSSILGYDPMMIGK
jgi:hypothetical protein